MADIDLMISLLKVATMADRFHDIIAVGSYNGWYIFDDIIAVGCYNGWYRFDDVIAVGSYNGW